LELVFIKGTKGFPYVLKDMKIIKSLIVLILFISSELCSFANDIEIENKNHDFPLPRVQGYITNKIYNPLMLKIFDIDEGFFYNSERNLEDDTFSPKLDLKITVENISDYLLPLVDENKDGNIFIPEQTKLSGYISEIQSPKKFNKRGFYKVTFNKAICPDGEIIYLKNKITSRQNQSVYNPLQHVGKSALGLVGGSLAGTLFSYGLGGLGLVVATHGYSLAAGAAAGGFIGTLAGAVAKGENAKIAPGQELLIEPVSDASIDQLKQINCIAKTLVAENISDTINIKNKNVDVEIISVKEKTDFIGENKIKLGIKVTNKTSQCLRLSNFYLRDSQGREYNASFIDLKNDFFEEFPPNETRISMLEFFVDYPKAAHWLVLKNNELTEEIGNWKIKG